MVPDIIGTLTFPCTQPLYNGIVGPYERTAGDWAYSIVCEIASNVSPTNIVAYKTPAQPDSNYGKVWTRVAAGPATPNGHASVFRLGTSDTLTIGYQDNSATNHGVLQALTFDMVAETFGSPDSTGSGAIFTQGLILLKLTSGDLVFLHDNNDNGVFAFVKSSGVWGSRITLDAGPRARLNGALRVTDTNIKVLVNHYSAVGFQNIVDFTCYTFDGATVTGTSTAYTVSGTDVADPRVGTGVYDAAHDRVAWPIVNVINGTDNNEIFVLSGQASVVAPAFTDTLVYEDADPFDSIGPPLALIPVTAGFIIAFDLVPSDASPERIYTCSCSTLDGTWGAPVLFYDLAIDPPSPPPHNDVIFPVFGIENPDGTFGLTIGLTQTVETHNFCGVLYFLASSASACGDPIQVSSDAQFRQSASEINPYYFEVGTDLYQVLVASQGEAKIGIFKRAKSSTEGAWAEQDSGSSPDNTAQSGFLNVIKNGTKLAILYLLDDFVSIKIVEFDTATDTYGAPTSALTIPSSAGTFGFVLKGSRYVVIGSGSTGTYVVTNTGGAWSSIAVVLATPSMVIYGALLDVFGMLRFFGNRVSQHLDMWMLDNSLALVSFIPHTFTNNLDLSKGRPSMVQISSTSYAVGFFDTLALNPFLVTIVTNSNTSPVYTITTVYVQPSIGDPEGGSYATLVLGLGGNLTAFYVRRNIVSMPVVNEVDRSTYSSGTWGSPVTYYDAVADPPAGGTSDTSQIIRALQPIQFGSGWSLALTMNTFDDPDTFQTGFFIDACGAGQTLQLTKTVIGGSAVPAMWLLTGTGPTPISGAGDTGALPVDPGTYALIESVGPDGYTAGAWDCGEAEMPTATTVVVPEGVDVVCNIDNTAGTPPFRASCPSPIYVVGTPYSSFVTVVGGVPPYTFTLLSGSLPTGLSLNASTGELSGTPSATGPFTFVIRVTDDNGDHADTSSCSAGRCPGTRSII